MNGINKTVILKLMISKFLTSVEYKYGYLVLEGNGIINVKNMLKVP